MERSSLSTNQVTEWSTGKAPASTPVDSSDPIGRPLRDPNTRPLTRGVL
jgi:hypothetical protein